MGFRNGPRPTRTSALMAGWVPAKAVQTLLFGSCGEETGMWAVLTWDCRAGKGWDQGCALFVRKLILNDFPRSENSKKNTVNN